MPGEKEDLVARISRDVDAFESLGITYKELTGEEEGFDRSQVAYFTVAARLHVLCELLEKGLHDTSMRDARDSAEQTSRFLHGEILKRFSLKPDFGLYDSSVLAYQPGANYVNTVVSWIGDCYEKFHEQNSVRKESEEGVDLQRSMNAITNCYRLAISGLTLSGILATGFPLSDLQPKIPAYELMGKAFFDVLATSSSGPGESRLPRW